MAIEHMETNMQTNSMLIDKNIEFSKLNCTYLLEFNSLALSSITGFLICGNFEQNYYKQNNVFAVPIFETHKICLAFYDIINFFSKDEQLEQPPTSIISLNNEILYWQGDTLFKDSNVCEKRIHFCIENQSTQYSFDLFFSNFQNFIIAVQKTIRGTFCFKLDDYIFLNFILKQSLKSIYKCSDYCEAIQFVKIFSEKHEQYSKSCMIDFLQYYLEIILVLKRLDMLIMDKIPRNEILKSLL
jgi:hypothetical protein